jgi:hypothetical protein
VKRLGNIIAILLMLTLIVGIAAWLRGDEKVRDIALISSMLLTLVLGVIENKRRKAPK